jgi:hypothetical protein
VHWFHLPLRLAIELTQIGGALTLLVAFRNLGVNRWACLASFLLLCLHPMGFQENHYTMSDTFYVAMLWYVLGGLLLTLATRSWWSAAGTGIAIAILWNTREEGLVLIAVVGLWFAIFCLWKKGASTKSIAITSGTAIILIHGLRGNDRVFVPSCSRYRAGLQALSKLVASNRRPIAWRLCVLSGQPDVRQLQTDGPLGESWRVETMRRTGAQIGVGWIVGATRRPPTQGICLADCPAFSSSGPRNQPPATQPLPTVCPRWFPRSFRAERRPAGFPLQPDGGSGLRAVAGQTTRDDPSNERRSSSLRPDDLRRSSGATGECSNCGSLSAVTAGLPFLLHTLTQALIYLLLSRPKEYRGLICAIVLLAGAVLRAALLAGDATAFDNPGPILVSHYSLWSVIWFL